MPAEENKAIVRRLLEELDEGVALDAVAARWLTPDFVAHPSGAAEPIDLAGYRPVVDQVRATFADRRHEIDVIVAEGDLVAAMPTVRGVHVGAHRGIAPTGRAFDIATTDVMRVRDGKVAEEWCLIDTESLLRQLGDDRLAARGAHEV
jgi:predicted ester cyclase